MENVLVIDRRNLNLCLGYLSGLGNSPCPLAVILGKASFLARDLAERDENFVQILPYCVLEHPTQPNCVFFYRRSASSGESRLSGRLSVGVGGHINSEDFPDGSISLDGYYKAIVRELREEVGIEFLPQTIGRNLAYIWDHSTPVGRVHLGVLYRLKLTEEEHELLLSRKFKGEISDTSSGFITVENSTPLLSFEEWSRFVVMAFANKVQS